MAAKFENFGLMDLVARPEDAFRLASLAMAEGQRIRGYRGDYFRCYVGDATVVVRAMPDPDSGEDQLLGMDTHAASPCLWNVTVERDVTAPDADPLSRQVLVRGETGKDTAVVSLVCADVLPALKSGTPLRMSVVGFPLRVVYSDDGCEPVVEAQEDTVLLQGQVTDVAVGETYFGMEPLTRFIRTVVATPLGPVELCHLAEMVPEEQKDLVRVGATVSAFCVLSGDVAVGDYAAGILYGEKPDLTCLREAFLAEDAGRLRPILHSQCQCRMEHMDLAVQGAEETIAALQGMMDAVGSSGVDVDFGRITGVDDGEDGARLAGRGCLLLGDTAYPGYYALLCLIETDSVGRIRQVTVTNDQRYEFEQDFSGE